METDTQEAVQGAEEWFLAQLEQPELHLEACMNKLTSLYEDGRRETADSLSELLQDTLQTKEMPEEAFKVFRLRALHHPKDAKFKAGCEKAGLSILGNTPDNRVLFKNVGFDEADVSMSECFRRLDVLRSLEPDALCLDKTWGFGMIRGVDHFYERVEIDFDRKKEHEMAFNYAAKALEVIDDGHLLAIKHKDPDKLAHMIKKEAAEVVRIALRNYGNLSIQILQEKLIPDIIPESGWKRFWDAARKELKQDPLVEIPSRRTEPIVLREEAKAYDEAWILRLADNKTMDSILSDVEEFVLEGDVKGLTDEQKAVFADRLAFVIKGAGMRQPLLVAKSVLAGADLGLDMDQLGLHEHAGDLLAIKMFAPAVESLPAKDAKRFLNYLADTMPERAFDLWLDLFEEMDCTVLSEIIELLDRHGRSEECGARIKQQIDAQAADVDVLLWIWRNDDYIEKWNLGSMPELLEQTLRAIEIDHVGNRLKTQNQLRERFRNMDWLNKTVGSLNTDERKKFFLRIKESSAWPEMDHRSVLGWIIKTFPEFERLMRGDGSASQDKPRQAGPQTSERTFRERQLQLEKLKNVEIPQNSKEIGLARSYGDLKENHEFKAAKEMQSILLRREAELENMLLEVKPTDFADASTDEVSMGTRVSLAYPDGKTEEYTILGVWDRDENLNIISSETRMALSLIGQKEGDEVVVPTEAGDVSCRITSIGKPSEQVQAWLAAIPTEARSS